MMTREEAFREYEETLDKLSTEFNRAKAETRATLHEQLKVIRATLHSELKAVRAIQQKTKRSAKCQTK